MSIHKITAVQGRRKELDPGSCHARIERLVLISLADNANDDGFCWPSREELAWKSGIDPRSIPRILQKFETSGEVYIERRGNGPKDPNWYLVCLDMTEEQIVEALQLYFKYDKKKSKKVAAEIMAKLRARTWNFGPQKEHDFSNKGDSARDKGDIESPKPSLTVMEEEEEGEGDSVSPLGDDSDLDYVPLDENGDEEFDPSEQALLERCWKATVNAETRGAVPKLTQTGRLQWAKLYRMVLKDDQFASFVEHQIEWCWNDGTPRTGFKNFLTTTLSHTIYKNWLNQDPVSEGFDPAQARVEASQLRKKTPKRRELPPSSFEQDDCF